MLYVAAEVLMRTIAIAIALVLGLAGTASAASRHGKKHHHARSVRHAKLKTSHHSKHA